MHINNPYSHLPHKDLAALVYKTCHLNGDFLLRSGQRSNEYFDKYRLEAHPEMLIALAQRMKDLIPVGTEVLAGLEMGGIPIATALSLLTGIPVCFVRKEAKTYGTCQFAEGTDIKNKNVCIIEDVITSGGQVVISANDLKNSGAHIHHVLCIINRGGDKSLENLSAANLKLKSLFNKSDF